MKTKKKLRPIKFDYDVIVIGSGGGGSVAVRILAKMGKKVAIVEKDKYGGECPNYGCIPTKSLLQSAEVLEDIKASPKLGLKVKDLSFSYHDLKSWKDKAVANTGVLESKYAYSRDGIHVIDGTAHFINKWQVSINNSVYSAKRFLIATGTKSFIPPIIGLKESGCITYREALELNTLPKSIFIIGGGAIGCEFAELYSSLGSEVYIADMTARLLPNEDKEAGELLEALFDRKGVKVFNSTEVTSISLHGAKKQVSLKINGQRYAVVVDEVLVTAGKMPNTDLGLENAGVHYTNKGIKTNSFMQTSTKNIFAAGDVTGLYMYMHTAAYQSRIAAYNMFKKKKMRAKYNAIPRCTFVRPEIASVGLNEEQVKKMKIPYQVGAVPISVVARANTANQRNGFVKVLASHTGVLLGATIVAPRAGEMIHEIALAINHSMKADAIANTVHAFPTWSEAVKVACQKIHCQ